MTDKRSTKKPKFVGENKTYQSSIACLDLYLIKRTAVSFLFLRSATVFLVIFLYFLFLVGWGIALAFINKMNCQESFASLLFAVYGMP